MMKNGQNSQQDESPLQPVFSTSSTDMGWGNNRCSTHLDVTETSNMFLIKTILIGLEPDSLIVTIRGFYFIVEGTLAHNGGRGRYARYVAELVHVQTDYIDVTYQASGELMIRLLKREPQASE